MDDHHDDVKYERVSAHDHSSTQCPSENMKKLSDNVKINLYEGDEQGKGLFLYIAVCVANLTSFVSGVAIGWTSPVIPKLNGEVEPESNPLSTPITINQQSWLGSLLPLGAVLGPFAAGLFVDTIGRKKSILISTLPFMAAFSMAIFTHDINLFYLMRFLCGLAMGGVFAILPMYVAEVAEDCNRGALGSLFALFICIGILFAYCIGPYVSLTVFNIICVVPSVIFFPIFLLFIPDSPHYLISRGDYAYAEEALMKFRQKSRLGVQKELLEIKDTVNASMRNKGRLIDLFRSKGLLRALMISLGLVGFQQLSGINIVLFYTQTIFLLAGTTIPSEISTIIVGVVQILAGSLTPLLVERTGKRLILIFSAVGMACAMALLGLYFYIQNSPIAKSHLFWLPIASLICYNISYSAGFGPLPWAVLGEVFPANVKSAASTLTASVCWLLAFIITNIFGVVIETIGIYGTFWLFSSFCIVAVFFVYFLLPETSGKTLQEIQAILNGEGA
ncbi:hypothetical protein PPYR_11143 [Photinus pyralis]|uniref:Major facilitator superfamily (MFS) profile domain-containing protein n=1 Tax=Photinus pyralis TaxID=7054 RepID=A0A1Y1NLV8_PHOPY|nr:facilitated trehalose transporter Tret1-like [Photinus pyralis]KAB0794304.1 hypothetical protein PPYR_11143 [Photinus pyralis]